MKLQIREKDADMTCTVQADIVIAADGPNSAIRQKYLPKIRRDYVGYVAWRGVVPVARVKDSTRSVFVNRVTVHRMPVQKDGHCLVYTIPGEHGSLEPDERMLNFVWYTSVDADPLDEIMEDGVNKGHRHHYIVPSGHVRKDIWKKQLQKARDMTTLPEPFLEVLNQIRNPFIQVLTEFCSPRAVFEDGRVLLIGDGLSLYRPHTAFSGTQAAFHALMVERYLSGEVGLDDYEDKVVRYARLHWSQARMWGCFYQHGMLAAPTIVAALYHLLVGRMNLFRSWTGGEKPLLRGTDTARD
ncbi:hypothetical protein V8F33_013081 [Rhypophila sp. PSN 637]